jgi:hypothetical protein
VECCRSHHVVEDAISHRAKRAAGSCMKKSLCNGVSFCAALRSVEDNKIDSTNGQVIDAVDGLLLETNMCDFL